MNDDGTHSGEDASDSEENADWEIFEAHSLSLRDAITKNLENIDGLHWEFNGSIYTRSRNKMAPKIHG